MQSVLAFLRDEGNRALLGWVGGGLVFFAGLWAVFAYLFPAPEPKPSNSVEVHNGNVIASRPNATFSAPVTINPNAKEVVAPIDERLEKLAIQVAREKGVEVAPLRSILDNLGAASFSAAIAVGQPNGKGRIHIRIVRAAALWRHPIGVLRRVLGGASLAVDAILRVDDGTRIALFRLIGIDHLIDGGGATEPRRLAISGQLHISA